MHRVQIDAPARGVGIDDCLAAIAGSDVVPIVSRAAKQLVVPLTAVEAIVVAAAAQVVRAVTAAQYVISRTAEYDVILVTPIQGIRKESADQQVVATAAIEGVGVGAAADLHFRGGTPCRRESCGAGLHRP